MKATIVSTLSVLAVSGLVLGSVVMAAEPKSATEPKQDAQTACLGMMQGPGVTEEGTKAMREFMQSPKAGQAMSNMMAMARRMGNGDVMVGMTKMMEMMGSMGGGMMGGSGSMGQGGMMGRHSTPGPREHQ